MPDDNIIPFPTEPRKAHHRATQWCDPRHPVRESAKDLLLRQLRASVDQGDDDGPAAA